MRKGTVVEDRPRERSTGKTRTGQSTERGESQRVRLEESSGKRSSKDGKGSRDSKDSSKTSSKGRDKDQHSRGMESKPDRSRVRDSRGVSEGKGHHQSSERSKERRKEESRDSKTKDRGRSDRRKEHEQHKLKEGSHSRSSGSHDRESKEAKGEEKKKREIIVREDPPSKPVAKAHMESVEGGDGHGVERKPPQRMVEVTEEPVEDEYQYEDEDFEVILHEL